MKSKNSFCINDLARPKKTWLFFHSDQFKIFIFCIKVLDERNQAWLTIKLSESCTVDVIVRLEVLCMHWMILSPEPSALS